MILMQTTIFIILAGGILVGMHYFFYFSLIRFFSITNPLFKNIFLAVIAFLGVSFILTSFIACWWKNFFIRALYFISGFWLGLLGNLIMAAVVVWLIVFVAQFAGSNANKAALAAIFFALALVYSLYGVVNAFNPRIKNISVSIPNLPEQWKNKKIVQLSDIHLGLVYRESFMRDIVEKVNSVNSEMVVVTGDYFDGMGDDLNSLSKPLNDIQTEKGVFFVTGNHETYLGVEKALVALEKTKVKILRDEVVDVDGLKLIGIDYSGQGENKDVPAVIQSLEKYFSGKPNILLYHSPVYLDQFKKSGVNLQLSGHTHAGQIFPVGYITKLVYKGYDYGLHQIGDFTIYATSGIGTWGPAMRTGNTPEIVVITLK
jgi:predicted MPP superfamily phosphohydrolase